MRAKPHIVRNRQKHAPYLWRCFIGRYNGYADTIEKAYAACIKCLRRSKYWELDIRRNPQLLVAYQQAQDRGII